MVLASLFVRQPRQWNHRPYIITLSSFHRLRLFHQTSVSKKVPDAASDGTISNSTKIKEPVMYLHLGPSGDCWTGDSIFAAKHLQPDYVRSIPLKSGTCTDTLLEVLEENENWAQEIYDTQSFPSDLMHRLKEEGTE